MRHWDLVTGVTLAGLLLGIGGVGYSIGVERTRLEARKTVRAGERKCAATWATLMQLPVGEFAYVPEPPLVIQKTGLRELAYRPLPTKHQRQITNLFATPPVMATSPKNHEDAPAPSPPPPAPPAKEKKP